ncbi:hypothetical protein HYC85_026992 [Camellia sinensis]|uniref:Uncharacterized protein n=1 Tax=Camellia sinensis TaxID=4442 RepID=A0A7J7G546_CAMSI|nr:hypothetical protein HYC85_026992 [Camellia sinensis]
MGSLTQHKLPIIDFTKENLKPGTSSWDKTSKQSFMIKVFNKVEELFELPTATKMQNKASIPLYGYVGQTPSLPLCESMGIDGANTLEGIQKFTNIMWPNGNDDFRAFAKVFDVSSTYK